MFPGFSEIKIEPYLEFLTNASGKFFIKMKTWKQSAYKLDKHNP